MSMVLWYTYAMLESSPTSTAGHQINEQIQDQLLAKDMQIAPLKEAYDFLQSQLDALKRMIFGSKSERFIDPESKQPSLLDEHDFSVVDATGAKISEHLIQVAPHSRKKEVNPHKSLITKNINKSTLPLTHIFILTCRFRNHL